MLDNILWYGGLLTWVTWQCSDAGFCLSFGGWWFCRRRNIVNLKQFFVEGATFYLTGIWLLLLVAMEAILVESSLFQLRSFGKSYLTCAMRRLWLSNWWEIPYWLTLITFLSVITCLRHVIDSWMQKWDFGNVIWCLYHRTLNAFVLVQIIYVCHIYII